jgi:hypothetical protein
MPAYLKSGRVHGLNGDFVGYHQMAAVVGYVLITFILKSPMYFALRNQGEMFNLLCDRRVASGRTGSPKGSSHLYKARNFIVRHAAPHD